MSQDTLAIIKPDAVKNGHIGGILSMIDEEGLRISALKMAHLSQSQAQGFYHVHRERSFFNDLTEFMSEGPVVLLVLTGEDAILRWRNLMGATNPAEAAQGTVRDRFGESIERNASHGSDSPESASFELGYFFSELERFQQPG